LEDYIFKIDQVRKIYNYKGEINQIIFNNIYIPREMITFIKGETGIGKTTLLNILGLMDKISFMENDNIIFLPDPNQTIDFRNIYSKRFKKYRIIENIRKNYFGFMFQHDHLIDAWKGWENIILPDYIRNSHVSISKYKNKIHNLIELCNFSDMHELLERSPSTYSGGQRQRTALLRALIHSPKVIFADEPFASISKKKAMEILNVFKNQAQKNGTTIIIVSHDIHDDILQNININEINLNLSKHLKNK